MKAGRVRRALSTCLAGALAVAVASIGTSAALAEGEDHSTPTSMATSTPTAASTSTPTDEPAAPPPPAPDNNPAPTTTSTPPRTDGSASSATNEAPTRPAPTPEPVPPALAPGSVAPLAVVPGSLVDVTINVSGPASGIAGGTYVYTAVIGNNSLPDADGATFTITTPSGSTSVAASCVASGGATCPAALTTTNTQVKGTAGLLPHNGQLTITITGRFAAPSPSSVTSTGTVAAPAGTTDYDLTSNQSAVATTVTSVTGVVVSQTQSAASMSPGSPNTYTLTWTNNGPADAAGTVTLAMMYFRTDVFNSATITGFTCTASGGLVCPTTSASSVSGNYGVIFSLTQASFPAGATMTVTYTADLVAATTQACGFSALSVGNDVRATVPNGFTNTGTTDLFIYASAPGTPACPTTDLTVTKSQTPTSIAPGAPVTYTVTYRNIGPSAANGASLTDAMYFSTPVQSLQVHIVSCTVTGGATCPTLADKTLSSTGAYVIQITAPTFPAGSTIQVVYTADMTQAANPSCSSSGSSSVENRTTIAVPAGVIEVGNGPNQASVFATAPSAPPCPRATLAATKTVDKTTLFPGDPTTYTVTYTNRGPDAADGAWISDYLQLYNARFINNATITILSCTGTGGASCPSFITNKTVSNDSYLWSGSIGAFPNGATLTIVVAVNPTAGGSTCPVATATVPDTAQISLPSGMTGSNGTSGAINVTAACADIAVNKSINQSSVRPGDPVTYSVKVSNASIGAARSVQFTDALPRGFVYSSATCTPSSGTSTCATPSYDATSRTVSAVIPVVGPNQGFVTITIAGTVGPVGGTYSNTATAGSSTTGADRFIDPVPTSNTSTAVLTIYGTASKVIVTKNLTGLPAGGVPAALTFSGSITCDFEGAKPWTVTVPAGASSATAAPVLFFDGQECTVSENTPPTLPSGFSWVDAPVVEPSALTVAGPTSEYDVTVTNPLTPNAQLSLAKTVSRTQATVGQDVTFTYQVTNGGLIPVSAPVIHETSFSGSGQLPAAVCPAGEIPPGASVDCVTTYTVTSADVTTWLLTNVAYATATPSAGPEPRTPSASASVRLVAPPSLTLTKSAEPATYATVGEEITYSYVVTNTGGLPLTALTVTETSFSGTGDAPQPLCPASAETMAAGESTTCTASYTVTQADLDRGSIINTAVATANAPDGFVGPVSPPASATVTASQQPSIHLTKSVFPSAPITFVPGTPLTYSFVVTNTGNVTLTGVRVDETAFTGTGEPTAIVCETTTIAPSDQVICSATYQITENDVGAGVLMNTATATGTPPGGPDVTSAADTATVPDASAPALSLLKSATPTVVHLAHDTVAYRYDITNTGNVPLTDPVITETAFTGAGATPAPTCPLGTILPGETITCSATYSVVVADLRKEAIVNTATASATAPDAATTASEPSAATVDVVPGIPGITLVKSASPTDITTAGQEITYTFEVTNSGESPLEDVTVTENDFSGTGAVPQVSCPTDRTLAIGDTLTCAATYIVTQADVDSGGLVNTAHAGARVPGTNDAEPIAATDSVEVPIDARPALTLTKSVSPAAADAFVAGRQVTYTFVITNTGNVSLTAGTILEGTFTGSGVLTPVTCSGPPSLAPGGQTTCTASYTLTQADIDAGTVSNTAQAIALPPVGDPVRSDDASANLPVSPAPALDLVKSATPAVAHQAGDTIAYTFDITNTGNVTLTDVAVSETSFTGTGPVPTPSCPTAAVAPGQVITCTSTYTVTSADVQRGSIQNSAVATGAFGDVTTNPQDTMPFAPSPTIRALLDPGTVTSSTSSALVEIEPLSPAGGVTDDDSARQASPSDSAGGAGQRLPNTGTQIAVSVAFAALLSLGGMALSRASRRQRPGRR